VHRSKDVPFNYAEQLLEYKTRSYLSLSDGEKQQVILARAIAQQPDLMILDEPTNHLDIRRQILSVAAAYSIMPTGVSRRSIR